MRRASRWLLTLAVLAAVLVVVDRAAAFATGRTLADRVADELVAHDVRSAPPEVTVGGFPFLTQVATGRYESVTLRLRDVGSDEVRLPRVELVASGVTAPARALATGEGSVHAARLQGSATLGYEQVRRVTGYDELRLAADEGRLSVRVPVELSGEWVVLVGTAEATVTGHTVRIEVTGLGLADGRALPPGAQPVVDRVARDLSVTVELPPLPYGLSLTSVRAEPAGLVVAVEAFDVPLTRPDR